MTKPGYCLPDKPASFYSEQALKILTHIAEKMPLSLPFMLRSDIVLTISGVRALTTYIDSSEIPEIERSELTEYLKSCGIELFQSDLTGYPPESESNWYVVHNSEFRSLPQRYPDFISFVFPVDDITTLEDFVVWTYIHEATIRDYLVNQHVTLGDDETRDSQSAAHNIRFGMVLGYPMAAIWEGVLVSKSKKTQAAKIAYADKYDSAQPVYDVDVDVTTDSSVIAHQKLWSDILTQVYESDWHVEVASTIINN